MSKRDIIRVCGLLWALAALPSSALAEQRTAPVRGTPATSAVGPECAPTETIEQRIEYHLGRSLHEADPTLQVSTAFERTNAGYRLQLHVTRSEDALMGGARSFEGTDCRALWEAAALLVALSIDPLAAPKEEPLRSPAAKAPPAPTQAVSEPVTPSTPTRSLRGAVRAGALLEVGYLPRAGAGAELAGSLSFSRSRIELTALFLPGVRSERADDGARVEVALWAARLSYCQRVLGAERWLALAGCAGLELGRATGRGLAVEMPSTQPFVWSASWLSLRLASELTRWLGISLEPGLALPFARSRFVSSDANGAPLLPALHTPKPVSLRVGLSLEALF